MSSKLLCSLAALLALPARGQDLFLAAKELVETDAAVIEKPAAKTECPPLKWIKESLSTGAFILNYTDESWGAYMNFLHVDKVHWHDEFFASDIWQYVFYDNTFVMNHTIPKASFHLLYEAGLSGKWEKNPYPFVTPAGFDKHAAVNLSTFSNIFEQPGVPHPDSCWALRTEMPVVNNITGTPKEYIVKFWREMTSPSDIRCTLTVYDAKTKETIEPWRSQMQDVKPYPNYAYRYFRRTVQSFPDVVKRLPCQATGERDGTYFC